MSKYIRYFFHSILFLGIFNLLFSCALLPKPDSNHTQESNTIHQKEPQSQFNVLGYASIDLQHGENKEQKILNARKASAVDAYKGLAEYLYGAMLQSVTDVKDMKLQQDKIKSRVAGLVRGAKVSKSYYEGNTYITELQLNLDTLLPLSEQESVVIKDSQPILNN